MAYGGNVGAVGGTGVGGWTSTGAILVLFILLVIISKTILL
ncbi:MULTISPECIES: YjcZ family sporulation protein [unclassified Paenibacillus]